MATISDGGLVHAWVVGGPFWPITVVECLLVKFVIRHDSDWSIAVEGDNEG